MKKLKSLHAFLLSTLLAIPSTSLIAQAADVTIPDYAETTSDGITSDFMNQLNLAIYGPSAKEITISGHLINLSSMQSSINAYEEKCQETIAEIEQKKQEEEAERLRQEEEARKEQERLAEEARKLEEQRQLEASADVYSLPSYSGFKSYMYYTAITSTGSPQYQLQQKAYTGNYGIRMVDDRYCVALGTRFTTQVGRCVDLILQNGTVIPCVLGDLKSNNDTDSTHTFTGNGCCSEFIVDKSAFSASDRRMGDASYCTQEWNSPVVAIRVLDKNLLY